MKTLQKFSNIINTVVSNVGMILFIVLIIACVGQVLFRFALNHSLSWTEELARYCFVWMHMLGASLLIETRGHATVTVMLDALHGMARKTFDLVIEIVILFNGSVMLYSGVLLAYRSRFNMSTAMSIPMWVINVSVAVGGILLVIQSLVQIVVTLHGKYDETKGGEVA